MNQCSQCRYWSDKQAEVQDGMTHAKCLSTSSPYAGQMVPVFWTCDHLDIGAPVDLEQD